LWIKEKDIQERESSSPGRKKKYRVYRKTVPYPYDEALQVAAKALAAWFVARTTAESISLCLKTVVSAPESGIFG
jgi:hypothetical protein